METNYQISRSYKLFIRLINLADILEDMTSENVHGAWQPESPARITKVMKNLAEILVNTLELHRSHYEPFSSTIPYDESAYKKMGC